MSVWKYALRGVRGRSIRIYDRKVEITVDVTVGSVITGNATDGEKTIYYTDVIGLQYKKPGKTIGYLQFETASGQMNNEKSGFWSENTFTFTYKEVDRRTIEEIVKYLKDRLEEIKYGNISSYESIPSQGEVMGKTEEDSDQPESEWNIISGYDLVWTEKYDSPNSLAPVYIEASALIKDTESADYIALLKLQNSSQFKVKEVTIAVVPLDADNNIVGDEITHVFEGSIVKPCTSFGSDEKIPLPDAEGISSYQATVKHVLFSSGLEWTN